METFEEIVEETIETVRRYGTQVLYCYLANLERYIVMAYNLGTDEETTTVDWSLHKIIVGALDLFSEIVNRLTPDEVSDLAHGTGFRISPIQASIFKPIDLVLLSGRVVAVKDRLVANVEPITIPGLNLSTIRIEWDGDSELEYREYLTRTAIDDEHWKWLIYCLQEVTNNPQYKTELNSEFMNRYGVTADDLFTCLKLLELIDDAYWNPTQLQLDNKENNNEPLWRLSYESLTTKLSEKLSRATSEAVVELLSWKPNLDLFKHPLIPDNKGNFMFAHWYWKGNPNPPKMWLYPYYYSGLPLSGRAGELRGKAFEKYLSEKVLEISNKIVIIKNREYLSRNYSSVRNVGLGKIEVDLAIRFGKVGLIVDAKGGVEELPKRIQDCLWNDISSDDVFHLLEENQNNADKWDKVISAIKNSDRILHDLGLEDCKILIPIIVHSKVQPIMIDEYIQKYGGGHSTQTHSIKSFLAFVEKTGKLSFRTKVFVMSLIKKLR